LRKWSAAVLLVLVASCRHPVREMKQAARAATGREPQIQATVVTIETTLEPQKKTTTSTIVIANDHARATSEIGIWRLFDLKQNRVAFIDDFERTVRYESLSALTRRRQDAAENVVNDRLPVASFSPTPARQTLLGVEAAQAIVKLGAYQREIWFGVHPQIPAQLFALMHASESASADAPVSRAVDAAFINTRGFPLREHSELPYANAKFVVDREVTHIERKNVDAALLRVPDGYREVMPAPVPVARPRRALTPRPPQPEPPLVTTATTATTATAPPPALTDTTTTAATSTTATTTAATTSMTEEKKAAPVVKKAAPVVKKAAPVVKKPAPSKKTPVVKSTKPSTKKTSAKKTTTTKKSSSTKKTTSTKKKS
jgi:hypothetical protein